MYALLKSMQKTSAGRRRNPCNAGGKAKSFQCWNLNIDGQRILVEFFRASNEALDADRCAFSPPQSGILLQILAKLRQGEPAHVLRVPCALCLCSRATGARAGHTSIGVRGTGEV